jgi:hypothetical protein
MVAETLEFQLARCKADEVLDGAGKPGFRKETRHDRSAAGANREACEPRWHTVR